MIFDDDFSVSGSPPPPPPFTPLRVLWVREARLLGDTVAGCVLLALFWWMALLVPAEAIPDY